MSGRTPEANGDDYLGSRLERLSLKHVEADKQEYSAVWGTEEELQVGR